MTQQVPHFFFVSGWKYPQRSANILWLSCVPIKQISKDQKTGDIEAQLTAPEDKVGLR